MPGREHRAGPGDVQLDPPGKPGNFGAERRHFRRPAAMLQRVPVALGRAALPRNGIVPFVRRKIFCRGRRRSFRGRNGIVRFVCRKIFRGAGKAGAGQRPRGSRIAAEAAMAPGVAIARRGSAPPLGRVNYRGCRRRHDGPIFCLASQLVHISQRCKSRIVAKIAIINAKQCAAPPPMPGARNPSPGWGHRLSVKLWHFPSSRRATQGGRCHRMAAFLAMCFE